MDAKKALLIVAVFAVAGTAGAARAQSVEVSEGYDLFETDPGETDLSAGGPYPKAGTTYEDFSGFDNDLAGDTLEFDQ